MLVNHFREEIKNKTNKITMRSLSTKIGWCWWYRKYAPRDTVPEGLEKEAPEAKKGLWANPQPVPPWEWRKGLLPKGKS